MFLKSAPCTANMRKKVICKCRTKSGSTRCKKQKKCWSRTPHRLTTSIYLSGDNANKNLSHHSIYLSIYIYIYLSIYFFTLAMRISDSIFIHLGKPVKKYLLFGRATMDSSPPPFELSGPCGLSGPENNSDKKISFEK